MKRKTIVKQYFFEKFFEKGFRSDIRYKNKKLALSNNPASISCFPRRLQDVLKKSSAWHFSSSKTSSRRLQDVFAIRLPKTSSKRFQDVLQLCLQDVFKTSWKTKKSYTEEVFTKTNVCWKERSMSRFACFLFT